MISREEKIKFILSVVQKWGGFSIGELGDTIIVVGELGDLIALVEYLSLDCIDVSVYSGRGLSSDSITDYTMEYSELADDLLDSLVRLSKRYDEIMIEEDLDL